MTIYAGTVLARLEEVDEPESVNVVLEKREATGIPAEMETTLWSLACNADVPLSAAEQEQMFSLLMEYSDIFASDAKDFGQTNKVCHKIFTGDAAPIRQQIRIIPPSLRKETKKLVQEMLDRQVIQPSSSPWASPIVLVRKKDGSTLYCIDYRKVNTVTRKHAYQLPRIDDTLDTLDGSKWFNTLDLISGYWQVEIDDRDRRSLHQKGSSSST